MNVLNSTGYEQSAQLAIRDYIFERHERVEEHRDVSVVDGGYCCHLLYFVILIRRWLSIKGLF